MSTNLGLLIEQYKDFMYLKTPSNKEHNSIYGDLMSEDSDIAGIISSIIHNRYSTSRDRNILCDSIKNLERIKIEVKQNLLDKDMAEYLEYIEKLERLCWSALSENIVEKIQEQNKNLENDHDLER